MRAKYRIGIGASILLGLIFVTAGLGKLIEPAEVFTILTPFGSYLTPSSVRAIFTWLPRIELILGSLLVVGIFTKLVATSSLVLIVSFIAHNSWLLSRGLGYKPCGCLGILERITQLKLTASGALYLDLSMLVLVVAILTCYPGNFFGIRPWFLPRGRIDLEELELNG